MRGKSAQTRSVDATPARIPCTTYTSVVNAFGDSVPPLALRTASALVDLIRDAILDGRLKPDEELKEERLARDLGTSRTPVREALLRLKTEGLIDESAGRPARVRVLDAESLSDIYELRAMPLAGRRSGSRPRRSRRCARRPMSWRSSTAKRRASRRSLLRSHRFTAGSRAPQAANACSASSCGRSSCRWCTTRRSGADRIPRTRWTATAAS